jgi:WD40 repeat protein
MQTQLLNTKPVTFNNKCQEFLGHTDRVTAIIELSDGRIASASKDKTIRIWDGPKCVATIKDEKNLEDMIQLKDGNLAVVSFAYSINIYSLKDYSKVKTFKHNKKLCKLVQLNDGILAIGTEKGVVLYDVENGKIEVEMTGHLGSITGICELADGNIATSSLDRTVIIWSRKGMMIKSFKHNYDIQTVVGLKDGRLAFSAGVEILIAKTDGTIEQTFKHMGGTVRAMFQLHDGRLVSGTDGNNSIKVWDLNGNEKQKLQSDWDVRCLNQKRDGTLLSGSFKKVQLWVVN